MLEGKAPTLREHDNEDEISREEALTFVKDCAPNGIEIICDNCWVGKYKVVFFLCALFMAREIPYSHDDAPDLFLG